MNRRRFLETAALAPLAAPQAAKSAPTSAGRMKCGTQHNSTDEVLTICAALGVNHICSTLPSAKFDAAWSVEGLTKFFAMDDAERAAMGARGRALVQQRYAWPVVAGEMARVYRWLAGRDQKPASVAVP